MIIFIAANVLRSLSKLPFKDSSSRKMYRPDNFDSNINDNARLCLRRRGATDGNHIYK